MESKNSISLNRAIDQIFSFSPDFNMSGRRGRHIRSITEEKFEVLFEIGRTLRRGEEYNFDPEFDTGGFEIQEFDRMVAAGQVSRLKFKIIMEGMNALADYRQKLDHQNLGEYFIKYKRQTPHFKCTVYGAPQSVIIV